MANGTGGDRHWAGWVAKDREENVTTAILLEEYKDAGYWARHYSTVRLTIGTFFLTAAGGMIYHQWDAPNNTTAAGAAVVGLIGFILFAVFSWLTFNEMNKQRAVVSEYRQILGRDEQDRQPLDPFDRWKTKTGMPLGLVFLIMFLIFTWLWVNGQFQDPTNAAHMDTKLPITITVGAGNPVTINVPVKVAPKQP